MCCKGCSIDVLIAVIEHEYIFMKKHDNATVFNINLVENSHDKITLGKIWDKALFLKQVLETIFGKTL